MRVHLSGICGTAMASLAGLLKEAGHDVRGSDQDVYPPMSTQLESLGIGLHTPYASQNVPEDVDLVVIGNALSRGNPEVEAVLDRKQRMASMPEVLGEQFIRGRRSLVIAGTHGKTTTTSIVAFLLDRAGLAPSFLVGGVPRDFGRSYALGTGGHFVVEGDEYDSAFFDKRPKFVHYMPDVAVINNLEFDHGDIYADLGAVQTAFKRLLSVIPRRGLLVAGVESPALRPLLQGAFCRVETFGIEVDADWRADDVRLTPSGSRFALRQRGKDLGEFSIALPGEHNVRNALAALAVADHEGVPPERVREALRAFQGVKRRLELKGCIRGIRVYDDFAHHPTAVRETLKALRGSEPHGRLFAVFEPRSYTSRTRIFEDAFAQAFLAADQVIVASAHLPAKIPEAERISEEGLAKAIRAGGGSAAHIPTLEGIVQELVAASQPGDRILLCSNGGFGGINQRLLAALAEAPR